MSFEHKITQTPSEAKPRQASLPPALRPSQAPVSMLPRDAGNQAAVRLIQASGGCQSAKSQVTADRVQSQLGVGQPLDPGVRTRMEPVFGQSLSSVRIHSDLQAAQLAQQYGARAFTVGDHIAFGPGRYHPGTLVGTRLLAHELTHVLQQPRFGSDAQMAQGVSQPGDTAEVEADQVADFVSLHGTPKPYPHPIQARPQAALSRQPESAEDENVEPSELYNAVYDVILEAIRDVGKIERQFQQQLGWHSNTRKEWIQELMGYGALLGAPGERTDAELEWIRSAVKTHMAGYQEHTDQAFEHWEYLVDEYAAESERLFASTEETAFFASEVLEREFAETLARVDTAINYLTFDDLAFLTNMLDHETHIDKGEELYDRQIKEMERGQERFDLTGKFQRVSTGELIWTVVGWESAGDFAADVGLTILTLGTSKLVRFLGKGAKAADRMRRLNRIRKMRQAMRKKRLFKSAEAILTAIPKVLLQISKKGHLKWLRKNWKAVAHKVATDLVGKGLAMEAEPVGQTATRRVHKELVSSAVKDVLGLDVGRELEAFMAARVFFLAGREDAVRSALTQYFLLNFRRRLFTNIVYYGLRSTGKLEFKSATVLDIANSTIFEMMEDFATHALSGLKSKVISSGITTVRKTIQKVVHGWINHLGM